MLLGNLQCKGNTVQERGNGWGQCCHVMSLRSCCACITCNRSSSACCEQTCLRAAPSSLLSKNRVQQSVCGQVASLLDSRCMAAVPVSGASVSWQGHTVQGLPQALNAGGNLQLREASMALSLLAPDGCQPLKRDCLAKWQRQGGQRTQPEQAWSPSNDWLHNP
jgi:hypothetical protein